MGNIVIEGRKMSFEDIKAAQWPDQKPYYEASLRFCHKWINGKTGYELKTSGSTGIPKTILVQREQMILSAQATRRFFNLDAAPTLLCCLNTQMIAGKMMLIRAMEWDGTVHLIEPASQPLTSFLPGQNFDLVAMVPLQLESSFESDHSQMLLHQIKNLIIGGAPISSTLRKKASLLNGNIYQTYGMTETVSHIALANLKCHGPLVYQTLPGVSIRQTADLRLEIAAPMANEDWIITNDIVEILSPSSFIWKGRADFTINSGGLKIQPEEVEALISDAVHLRFPSARFFIGCKADAKLGQKAILILEGKEENKSQSGNFLAYLQEMLPKFKAPKELHFVESFVETASGKTNRSETLKKLWGS
jgi:O-succinylbenzoic acid--CoA ligase